MSHQAAVKSVSIKSILHVSAMIFVKKEKRETSVVEPSATYNTTQCLLAQVDCTPTNGHFETNPRENDEHNHAY
jgi:hypothetical protein